MCLAPATLPDRLERSAYERFESAIMVKPAWLLAAVTRCRASLPVALVLLAAALVVGCESSSTVTSVATAPDAPKCQVSVSTPPPAAAEGGSSTFSITTQPECAWTATTSAPWISGISPASGQGNGNVAFRIAVNEGATARDGQITVNNSLVQVSQKAPCRYVLTPATMNMGVGGGGGQIAVATASECAWTASGDGEWITVAPPATGTGNGSVNFTIGNNTGSERTGSIVVAGQRATIVQSGTPSGATGCSYSISPASDNIPAAGGPGTPIDIQTQPGCAWIAVSNAPWIAITSAGNGTGNGSVAFTVGANTGAARTGTLTVAGRTFTVNQAATAGTLCIYTVAPLSQNAPASGSTGTVAVTTSAGCAWTATSSAAWITITAGAAGNGNGSVGYSVAANTGAARTGTVSIAGQTFSVAQAAAVASCTYTIAPTSQNVPAGASSGTVGVTSGASCAWTATSNASWLTVTSGAAGTGNGSVGYSVAANTGAARTGTLTIGGEAFTVTQAAGTSSCSYSITPPSQNVPDTASSGSVAVMTTSGCAWTASSNTSWLTISSGASGNGNGSVGFSVAANTGSSARSGTLTVAGQTFTVNQAAPAPSCTYSISPPSQNVSDAASSGSVTVTTTAGCAWTASSNASWLSITSGASGNGNGSVGFSVAANTGGARSGTLTIAGQTFTVNQAAPPPSCNYSISPLSQRIDLTGGVGSVNVTAPAGCAWTASSNATWIVITGGASGTGNGTVTFAVSTSTTGNRTGTLTIAGQTATVVQSQSPLSPLSFAPLRQ
jgi:all-beta uncharacterized protein/BACON domain-containing protein